MAEVSYTNKIFDPTASMKKGERIFRLVEGEEGVCVVLVDRDGNRIPAGFVMKLKDNGSVKFMHGVNSNFGLQLDEKGQIEIQQY
jgi:hypothetical protein